jgi:chromosome segregation ATPase
MVSDLERRLRKSESTAARIQARLSETQLRQADSAKALQELRRRYAELKEERDALNEQKGAGPSAEREQAVRLSGVLMQKAKAYDTLKRDSAERERVLAARVQELEAASKGAVSEAAMAAKSAELAGLRDENRMLTERLDALDRTLTEVSAALETAGEPGSGPVDQPQETGGAGAGS